MPIRLRHPRREEQNRTSSRTMPRRLIRYSIQSKHHPSKRLQPRDMRNVHPKRSKNFVSIGVRKWQRVRNAGRSNQYWIRQRNVMQPEHPNRLRKSNRERQRDKNVSLKKRLILTMEIEFCVIWMAFQMLIHHHYLRLSSRETLPSSN